MGDAPETIGGPWRAGLGSRRFRDSWPRSLTTAAPAPPPAHDVGFSNGSVVLHVVDCGLTGQSLSRSKGRAGAKPADRLLLPRAASPILACWMATGHAVLN